MGTNSKIEWTDHTLNIWWGCDKIRNNRACDMCYAERDSKRYGHDVWGHDKPRKLVASWLKTLDKIRRTALESGEKQVVFVGSMMDIFEKDMPLVDWHGEPLSWTTGMERSKFFAHIELYPELIFLLLTKRPQNILRMVPDKWHLDWPENVWTGYSAADQPSLEMGIDALLEVPSKHFLSLEPTLGPVDLTLHQPFSQAIGGYKAARGILSGEIHWVITGGESGPHARPSHPKWFRDIRDQCEAAGVMYHHKQNGEYIWNYFDKPEEKAGWYPERVGKKAAGRLLDGREHNDRPS